MALLSYPPIVATSISKLKPILMFTKLFKVKHEVEEIGQELFAIVDNGGRVQKYLD